MTTTLHLKSLNLRVKLAAIHNNNKVEKTNRNPGYAENSGNLSHFNLGSLIQLSNGDLKRVENLTRDDFMQSAKTNSEVQIDESQVIGLQIVPDKNCAIITFSVGTDKTQVLLYNS